jgi:hypothetical protein
MYWFALGKFILDKRISDKLLIVFNAIRLSRHFITHLGDELDFDAPCLLQEVDNIF